MAVAAMIKSGLARRLTGNKTHVLSLSFGPHQVHPHGKEKHRNELAGTPSPPLPPRRDRLFY
jgi:hypothetical protein